MNHLYILDLEVRLVCSLQNLVGKGKLKQAAGCLRNLGCGGVLGVKEIFLRKWGWILRMEIYVEYGLYFLF